MFATFLLPVHLERPHLTEGGAGVEEGRDTEEVLGGDGGGQETGALGEGSHRTCPSNWVHRAE